MAKLNDQQEKYFRNYRSYDPNKTLRKPTKKTVVEGVLRHKVEDILDKREFDKLMSFL